jgi:hypothetical protein
MKKIAFLPIFLIYSSAPVFACSACQFAWFDYFLPPVFLWTGIAILWFGLTAFLSAIFGIQLKGMPKPLATWVLLIIGLISSAIMMGPLTLFPFIVPAIVAFHWMFRKDRDKTMPAAARYSLIGLGSLAVLSILVAISLGIVISRRRTMGEYLVKWSGTMPAIGMVNGLKDSEPNSLVEYRYILAHGDGHIVRLAAKRIGAIGDPVTDIPLLEDAMKRVDRPNYSMTFQEAVDSLRARDNKAKSENEEIKKEKKIQ